MSRDAWSPDQYHRFRRERRRPFFDLLRLVWRRPGLRVVDLGCGSGELTRALRRWLPGADVLGVDRSPNMLARARAHARPGLTFEEGDAGAFDVAPFDLVFSNAALHWVEDHEALFPRLLAALRPGAQLAVQVPRNDEHASHRLIRELAGEAPWAERSGGLVRASPVLEPERYARLLHAHGLVRLRVVERVYVHELASAGEVAEWTRGTSLIPYLARLSEADGEAFVAAYRARLVAALGPARPFAYTFRRLFLSGVKRR